MKLINVLTLLAIISFAFLFMPSSLSGSAAFESEFGKCRIPSLIEAKQQSAAVFVGKIIEETDSKNGKLYKFKIEKYWKGSKKKTILINVNESVRFQSWFEVGKRYLVYAAVNDEKEYYVGRCSRSNEIENAADDLKSLGKARVIR